MRKIEGKWRHDGDCPIYQINGVCTCGLIHQMLPYPEREEYSHLEEDYIKHTTNLAWLQQMEIPKPDPISWEEAKKLLKEAGWVFPEDNCDNKDAGVA